MRKWTTSACVLAWCLITLTGAVALPGSARPAQASTGIASSATQVTLPRAAHLAAASGPATRPRPAAGRYVVQPGDTLSAIASALAVPGGWQALYAANERAIGPNPNLIHPGIALALPGPEAPTRYTVQEGDTLSGIAAALGVPGGWQALYAANRQAIGPDPDLIQPGTVLLTPHPAAPRPPGTTPGPAHQHKPVPPTPATSTTPAPSSQPATGTHGTGARGTTSTTGSTGVPPWLAAMLLTAAILIGAAFLAEPVMAIGRRRRAAARARRRLTAQAGQELDAGRLSADRTRIILADHDRLVVTYSRHDDTVYVLTPPGEDPKAVLRAARLILPEDTYQELAGHLGVSPNWPLE